jgi:hypothetical protein
MVARVAYVCPLMGHRSNIQQRATIKALSTTLQPPSPLQTIQVYFVKLISTRVLEYTPAHPYMGVEPLEYACCHQPAGVSQTEAA